MTSKKQQGIGEDETSREGVAQRLVSLGIACGQRQQPLDVDLGGCQHRLESRFRQAQIAPVAQAMATEHLRDLVIDLMLRS